MPDKPVKEFKGHADWIFALVFSNDGKHIASASRDRTVKVWDVLAGKDVQTLKGSPTDVKGVVFLEGGAKVASSTGKWNKEKKFWEGEIKIWDAKAGKEEKSLKGHGETIEGLALSKDGKLLASCSEDQTVKIWDLAAGKDIQTLKGHTGGVLAIAFAGDGKKAATASADKTVKIWDVAAGKDLATFKVETTVKTTVKTTDPKTKKETAKETVTKELGRIFTCVAFSPDGKKLAAGNLDGQIKTYDVEANKEIGEVKAHEGVWAIAYSPDGTKLATAGWDQTIKVWDANSRKELFTIKAHPGNVTTLAFSPDGQFIASGGIDGLVKLWNAGAAPAKK